MKQKLSRRHNLAEEEDIKKFSKNPEQHPESWQEKSNFGRRDDYTNESSYRKKKNKYYKEKPPHR
ncbi:MAG: hypothetical protein ACO1NW_19555 [Chitinophagaceae bacterium]